MEKALEAFKIKSLRPGQKEVIECMLAKKNVLCVRPTGSGKSLIFQIAAYLSPGITIVVCPLISLMNDQLLPLQKLGIPALSFSSGSNTETRDLFSENPVTKLIYIGPESLKSQSFQTILSQLYQRKLISFFIVDEAHVIFDWGISNFRKEYQLDIISKDYPDIPLCCFTATLTENVRTRILDVLKLTNYQTFVGDLDRPNILYWIQDVFAVPVENRLFLLEQAIRYFMKGNSVFSLPFPIEREKMYGSGIVYCRSRDKCEEVTEYLQNQGVRCEVYHAKIHPKQKEETMRKWMDGEIDVIVGTIAIGMGIDKADVRYVINYNMSGGIERFAQESGRAGRDGAWALSLTFFDRRDVNSSKYLLRSSKYEDPNDLQIALDSCDVMANLCKEESCRRVSLIEKISGQKPTVADKTMCCDFCSKEMSLKRKNMDLPSYFQKKKK
jgi:RecQ family ATP-dependent DNA helicase